MFPITSLILNGSWPNKSLERTPYMRHASCALLASQQPARRIPGVAQFWR